MAGGRKKQTVKPGPPSKPLPAQGSGNHKRTPSSAFDPAAGNDIYEPEEIVGERQKNMGGGKTVTQYEVKWKGYDSEHNTYEPIAHLAGCEDMIAECTSNRRRTARSSTRSLLPLTASDAASRVRVTSSCVGCRMGGGRWGINSGHML